jgi:hypothetical protein
MIIYSTSLRLCFRQPDMSLTECVTLPARVRAHAHQLSLSPSHYFRLEANLSRLMRKSAGN